MDFDPIVKPVAGHEDMREFVADVGFVRDTKALSDDEYAKYADKLTDGDLLIAGWGANFEMDREGESFMEGAFDRGLKNFLDGEATLAFHHKHDQVLGRVLDAERIEGKGVRIVARVDSQNEASPLRHIYEQVKKGSLNALSCGGFFKRKLTDEGWRISDVDLTEWSVTGVPVGKGCNFAVVAGKALVAEVVKSDKVTLDLPNPADEIREEDLMWINDAIASLNRTLDRISCRRADNSTTAV